VSRHAETHVVLDDPPPISNRISVSTSRIANASGDWARIASEQDMLQIDIRRKTTRGNRGISSSLLASHMTIITDWRYFFNVLRDSRMR
jgi:hypothetical protein